jgi:hypothetical protein
LEAVVVPGLLGDDLLPEDIALSTSAKHQVEEIKAAFEAQST